MKPSQSSRHLEQDQTRGRTDQVLTLPLMPFHT